MMSLEALHAPAPALSLESPAGRSVTLSQFRGKVVVLSFFDSRCDDICPVLAEELRLAMDRVAAAHEEADVELLTVNTDPLATSRGSSAPAELAMRGVPRWQFLTGPLGRLNSVWSAYGVSVDAQPSSGMISHSEEMYFIGPSGRLADRATPFADELGRSYRLPRATEERFATGIAEEVRRLLTPSGGGK
jgi:protein SCO1/2